MQEEFGTYNQWSGLTSQQKELAAYDKYGVNRFDVPLPPFGELLKEQLTAPFFCFQVGAAEQREGRAKGGRGRRVDVADALMVAPIALLHHIRGQPRGSAGQGVVAR